jgi:hypothetical protein
VSDPHRNAFGTLIASPAKLTYPERLEATRGLIGWLASSNRQDAQWLAAGLSDWLRESGDLASKLGLRPPQGSNNTPAELLRQEERDVLMVRLSLAVGGHKRAARILLDLEPAPTVVSDMVIRLRQLNAPTSVRAFNRARKRRGLS